MHIDLVETAALTTGLRAEILAVCREAYNEELSDYLDNAGPGIHLLGRVNGEIVSHAMIVERWLETPGERPLRTAYVELVATPPRLQRRGYATALMRRVADESQQFDIGALSPSDPAFYSRLGWEVWSGPLSVRASAGLIGTPGEQAMVMRLPGTPRSLRLDAPLSIEWRAGEVW